MKIFVLAWHRPAMTETCLRLIKERTDYPHETHVYINGYDRFEYPYVDVWLENGLIESALLDKRNTGCWYPKLVQHAMVPAVDDYYVVNDADVFPPRLKPDCWLTRLVRTMDEHQRLGFLAAQLPPQQFQQPYQVFNDMVYCKAVGNTLKMVRREAFPTYLPQKLGSYSDDSLVSTAVRNAGYSVAYSRNVYCLHAGQTQNWGYTPDQINQDPRKAGYGEPYQYSYDPETYIPCNEGLRT